MLHRHPTIMEKRSPNFTSIEVEFLPFKLVPKIRPCRQSDLRQFKPCSLATSDDASQTNQPMLTVALNPVKSSGGTNATIESDKKASESSKYEENYKPQQKRENTFVIEGSCNDQLAKLDSAHSLSPRKVTDSSINQESSKTFPIRQNTFVLDGAGDNQLANLESLPSLYPIEDSNFVEEPSDNVSVSKSFETYVIPFDNDSERKASISSLSEENQISFRKRQNTFVLEDSSDSQIAKSSNNNYLTRDSIFAEDSFRPASVSESCQTFIIPFEEKIHTSTSVEQNHHIFGKRQNTFVMDGKCEDQLTNAAGLPISHDVGNSILAEKTSIPVSISKSCQTYIIPYNNELEGKTYAITSDAENQHTWGKRQNTFVMEVSYDSQPTIEEKVPNSNLTDNSSGSKTTESSINEDSNSYLNRQKTFVLADTSDDQHTNLDNVTKIHLIRDSIYSEETSSSVAKSLFCETYLVPCGNKLEGKISEENKNKFEKNQITFQKRQNTFVIDDSCNDQHTNVNNVANKLLIRDSNFIEKSSSAVAVSLSCETYVLPCDNEFKGKISEKSIVILESSSTVLVSKSCETYSIPCGNDQELKPIESPLDEECQEILLKRQNTFLMEDLITNSNLLEDSSGNKTTDSSLITENSNSHLKCEKTFVLDVSCDDQLSDVDRAANSLLIKDFPGSKTMASPRNEENSNSIVKRQKTFVLENSCNEQLTYFEKLPPPNCKKISSAVFKKIRTQLTKKRSKNYPNYLKYASCMIDCVKNGPPKRYNAQTQTIPIMDEYTSHGIEWNYNDFDTLDTKSRNYRQILEDLSRYVVFIALTAIVFNWFGIVCFGIDSIPEFMNYLMHRIRDFFVQNRRPKTKFEVFKEFFNQLFKLIQNVISKSN